MFPSNCPCKILHPALGYAAVEENKLASFMLHIFKKKCDDDDCDSDDDDDDKVFESRNGVEQANDMPAHRGPSESAQNENGAMMMMMMMMTRLIFVTCTSCGEKKFSLM